MVFTKLKIIAGVLLTAKQKNIVKENFEVSESHIKLYRFPCCSKIGRERYVYGIRVHTYYRFVEKCEDCKEKVWYCDECIKKTNNGKYDVQKIFNSPVEVPKENLCTSCFADSKAKLEGNCKVCNRLPDTVYRSYDKWIDSVPWINMLKANLKDCDLNDMTEKVKFYYMLDDCLFCT